jgi:hypothetical protein
MVATQDCVHPSISVPWRGMKEKVYATEVRVCDDLINCIHLTAADIVRGQLFRQGLNFTSLLGVCSGEGKTLRTTGMIM